MNNINNEIASLRIGSELIRATLELTVPPIQQLSLVLRRLKEENRAKRVQSLSWQNGASIPGTIDPKFCTRVIRNKCISKQENGRIRKPKFMLELEFNGEIDLAKQIVQNFDVGDSYCVFFENPTEEVELILDRVTHLADGDKDAEFELVWEGEKTINYKHLPNYCTPRRLLSQFVDIRRAPGRSFIRVLAEYSSPRERRRLLELASTQGTKEFIQYVRQANLSITELFSAFPSIKPPLALLIELLPRLLPRHYTLANFLQFKKENSLKFHFVYSLLQQNRSNAIQNNQFGVCSQWLLGRKIGDSIWLAQKEPSKFRFPPISGIHSSLQNDQLLSIPLLMIGPGTGVSPFISFLQKIRYLKKGVSNSDVDARRILIYASSSLEDEFLFKEELEEMKAEGILRQLILCESSSREGNWKELKNRPPRICDALREISDEVAEFLFPSTICQKAGLIYACGDVKNMSRELWTCLNEILQSRRNLSPAQGTEHLKRMRQTCTLIEDVWS